MGHERLDLGLVGPTQNVLPTVIDPLAIVLLVPFPVFDLPRPGGRLPGGTEIAHGVHARVVGTTAELALQPLLESRFRSDLEHVDQERMSRRTLRRGRPGEAGWDPKIDDPGTEVVVVDPTGHGFVVAFRD